MLDYYYLKECKVYSDEFSCELFFLVAQMDLVQEANSIIPESIQNTSNRV